MLKEKLSKLIESGDGKDAIMLLADKFEEQEKKINKINKILKRKNAETKI